MPSFEHAPLKRHEGLAPLSRDHYLGLVQARRLIQSADEDDVARRKAVAEFIDAWDRDIVTHFRDEERLLTGLMDDADQRRLFDEHALLAENASRVREMRRHVDPDPSALRDLGRLLEQHIRWEERDLFNRLQTRLSEAQLAELQRDSGTLDRSHSRITKKA